MRFMVALTPLRTQWCVTSSFNITGAVLLYDQDCRSSASPVGGFSLYTRGDCPSAGGARWFRTTD